MKKILVGMMAFAAMFATSCQNDLTLAPATGETSVVSFSVGTPQIATRAYSDGLTATVLQYAVYDAEGNLLEDLTETGTEINGSTSVELQLATGNTYSVIFWAAAADAPYSVNFAEKTMTVDYNGALSNDENRDAFYKYHTFTVTGTQTETIELKRPFAQVNIGTSDYEASESAGYKPVTSAVTVRNIYAVLNLTDGTVSEEVVAEFEANAIPAGEAFPVAGYEYLAMNYVLVGADKEVVDVEFTYTDGANAKTRTVGSVPVQRNHRTNIYGQLLTSDVDVNVEINPEYEDPSYEIYNVVVDGVSYNDFRTAAAKALELNKAIEFIQNVTIEADETITVPADQTLTLNLNGYTLQGLTKDADKNDDGKITSADNEVMFDVRGTMNVNRGHVVIKHVGKDYDAFGWNACGEIFYVAFGGTLNVADSHLENFGGVPMAYAIDMVNATDGITVNVEKTTIKSSYIPVRVFNNGAGMNNVTIKNSTLEGTSRAFWVHIYTQADDASFFKNGKDTDGNGYKNETLNINIFNPDCNNVFKANNPDRLIEYGFTDAINPDENAALALAEGVSQSMADPYTVFVSEDKGMEWIASNVAEYDGFEGYTIKLTKDIDLEGVKTMGDSFAPIGQTGERDSRNRLICEAFKGTFDGQGHTVANLYQSGWDMGYEWGQYGSLGLFAELENATVKNVVLDGFEAQVEGGDISYVAGSATGTCVFENITIQNGGIGTYNNGCGGIIGWSGAGNYTFKNITLGSDVVLGGLWGSFDSSIGGVVGQAEPGATYNFENVTINCRIDAYNDCTASYDYYNYRMCGMIIGRCEETTAIDGRNYPDLSKYNITFNNVVVNYGDWMNYHYCRRSGERAVRIEPGFAYGGAADRDHTGDNVHCMECIPFDQLIGGDQYGVKGLPEVDGVTVNYPASYRREVSTAAALKENLEKGLSVILDADIDYGTTQLAITGENQVVDLGGHKLTTNMAYGGIALKNGASIKNGVIEHASTVAAIKAFNVGEIENVTIKTTCATADKTITAIAVQQGGYVGSIKNVTIEGVSQGIEVGYQATVDVIDNAQVTMNTNGTANGIGLVINGGKVGVAKNSTFKGGVYGVTMHLKGVFAVGLELQNCVAEGTTAAVYAWDEKGSSNTSGSLVLTYDASTTLNGGLVWDFEDECQSVVTLNKPE